MSYFVVAMTCCNQQLFLTKAMFVPTLWSLEGAVTLSTTVCDDLEVTQVTTLFIANEDEDWHVLIRCSCWWCVLIWDDMYGGRPAHGSYCLRVKSSKMSHTTGRHIYVNLRSNLKHKVWRWYGEKRGGSVWCHTASAQCWTEVRRDSVHRPFFCYFTTTTHTSPE